MDIDVFNALYSAGDTLIISSDDPQILAMEGVLLEPGAFLIGDNVMINVEGQPNPIEARRVMTAVSAATLAARAAMDDENRNSAVS